MIKSLREARITDALPRIVGKEDWVRALSDALGTVQVKILDFADNSQIYTALDRVPETILDALAVNWKIDWYDTSYSLEQKRRTVQNAIMIRRQLGTVKSVQLLLDSIYTDSSLEEWFQYGGKPGYFRIRTSDPLAAACGTAGLIRALESVKRLSAWLEVIIMEILGPPFEENPGELFFRKFLVRSSMNSHRFDGEFLKAVLGAYRFSHYQGGVRFGGEVDFDGEIPFGQTYGRIPFPRLTVRGKLRSQLPEEVSVCLGIGLGAFRNHEKLDFPRLHWRAFRFSHYQGTARFDGSAGFDGEIPFNQVRGKIPFPRLTMRGELRSHTPGRLSAFWRPGTFPFRHTLRAELPRLAWGGFRFSRCRGAATASVTFSCGFSKVGSRFSMAGFSGTSPIREQNRLVFGAVSVSGTAVRHIEGLSGTLTMDNWRTLDGDMLLDGAYQLDAYLREEKL